MKALLLEAIYNINEELKLDELNNIKNDTKIFKSLDSVAVLDLILEIEDLLQKQTGKYIQIANEHIMDNSKTPFKTFGTLLAFVEDKVNG